MTMIPIPPELEAVLRHRAEATGLSLEDYVLDQLDHMAPSSDWDTVWSEEAARRLQEMAQGHVQTISWDKVREELSAQLRGE